jgi:hypothetical protein
MEKLHEDCYSGGESPIMDSLWEPFISKSEDSIWDEFFSVDEDSAHSERESLESAMAAVTDGTPIQYKDAMKSKDAHKWKEAMDIEIENIRRNKTYTLKRTKHGEKAIGCRIVDGMTSARKYPHFYQSVPQRISTAFPLLCSYRFISN